ncbi:VOC family protein [Streptomyces sp. SAS_270]|uniref:VOC family protein n=1 Tax=Streptomyces sp. SAS_270 TaxID=3412748 RepID=UPI00403C4F21
MPGDSPVPVASAAPGGSPASAANRAPDASGAPAPFAEGVPCWVDAQLADVEAGKRFYGELFGWTFEEAYGSSAWAYLDGQPVAALAPKHDGRMPTVWTVYFAAPDATALARRIGAAGGQVIMAPLPVDRLGTTVLAADPEGAVFGLWQPGTHTGFGRRHVRGTFCWAELYARDTATVDRFYGTLFHDALFGPDATPDFGRAVVSDVFPAEMPPHFLVHFGVKDCEETLGAVQRLGGRVQATPFDTSYGRVAVVTDSQGASFAVLQR